MYYENITDWVPLKKQIGVLDSTQEHDVYVVVNFAFHDPEILLTKLAEMIFSGELKPNKEKEFAAHLEKKWVWLYCRTLFKRLLPFGKLKNKV